MKNWNVYQTPGGEIQIVKDGFNWWAFFFPGFWAYSRGFMWLGSIGFCLIVAANRMSSGGFSASENDIAAYCIFAAVMCSYGFFGNGWVAAKLEKQGYLCVMKIEAASAKGARAIFNAIPTALSDAGNQGLV